MTKIAILALAVCLALFTPFFTFSQWQWLNPRPSAYSCAKIIFTDLQQGFILQADGSLQVTTDEGGQWKRLQQFSGAVALDIKDSTGAIAGSYGVFYLSTDKGNTWASKSSNIISQVNWVDVVSRDTIFMANSSGQIFRSDDRGNTWKTFTCGLSISSVDFVNSKVGYAGGSSSHILKTEDGGATWKKVLSVNVTPSNTKSIQFINADTGFAFREHSQLLSTTDGGVSWKSYNIGDDIYAMHFVDKVTGFAVGEHGVSYRTDDGGATWKWIAATVRIGGYDLNSVYFINASVGFAAGARGRILKTVDGGTTWNTYAPFYNTVSALSVPSANVAYATVGNTIFKTSDSGQTWKELALKVGTNYSEYDVFQTCHFFSADTGFVTASDFARVYKTYDGGVNWKQIMPSQYGYDDVTDIQFLDKNTGFLAINIYYGGALVKTRDAGETWTQVWSSQFFGEVFDKIFFIDESNGYASDYRTLYKTADSAKTWTKLWEDQRITSICFTDAAHGFVTGENGMLKVTADSGKTWQQANVAGHYSSDDFYTIRFLNNRAGYLTGEGGVVYKTIDGGTSWQKNGPAWAGDLRVIHYALDTSVFVAGDNGIIIKTGDISDWRVDDLQADVSDNCKTRFSARLTAAVQRADSVQFEYGVRGYEHTVAATPASVSGTQQLSAFADSVYPGGYYQLRVKLFFKGRYFYSAPVTFLTQLPPPTPVITPSENNAICMGDSVVLHSSAFSGNQWLQNGIPLPNATAATYTVTQAGRYSVIQTTGCYSSDTATIEVAVNPVPARPVITASETTLYSSAATGNQWFMGDSLIAGATSASFTALSGVSYKVRVTVNNCTSAFSDVFTTRVQPLEKSIQAGPNPVEGQLYITYTGSPVLLSATLFDMYGRKMAEADFNGKLTMNMSGFQAGLYILHVINHETNEHTSRKILKN